MAKNKTEIHVTTVFDGELDATDVFVSLISHVGIFDVNPVLEGIAVRGIEIQMISDLPFFLKENNVEIAILTLPKNKAIDMADILIENGIKAIWNFAHVDLDTPDGVIVENVHLSESLMTLSYNLSQYRQEHVDDEK